MPLSAAPAISGALRGVTGVTLSGNAAIVQREYEVCFKCHSGANSDSFVSSSIQRPVRVYQTFNAGLAFATSAPASHPVTSDRQNIPGIGGSGNSLKASYKSSMTRVYCIDCHDPHGSNEEHILKNQNDVTYPTSAVSFPLCFKCHDETYLFTVAPSADLHTSHVTTHTNRAPCSACHDPHGVPAALGATVQNASHLINFDTRYAGIGASYNASTGGCSVTSGTFGACHTGGESVSKRSLRKLR